MSDQTISIDATATYLGFPNGFRVGEWQADARTGELRNGDRLERLEPKTMELLRLLADHAGQVLSREQILLAVWPNVVVADDALARAMFKLRRALDDDAKAARYIETLPKRGYRLIASVQIGPLADGSPRAAAARTDTPVQGQPLVARESRAPTTRRAWGIGIVAFVLIAITLAYVIADRREPLSATTASETSAVIERADDFYYRYSRADNEAAIALYERILAREPDRVAALRGLANALTQRMIRWPAMPAGASATFTTLSASLADGHLQEPSARRILERAELLARRAIAVDPRDSLSHRSLGLVLATQSRFDEAIDAYRAALSFDADAWGALINLSEALSLTGKTQESIAALIDAHAAMTRRYASEKQHILPYYVDLSVLIGDRLVQTGQRIDGEAWYRRALTHSPLHPAATLALAGLLEGDGRFDEARQLCIELNARVGEQAGCVALLAKIGSGTSPPR